MLNKILNFIDADMHSWLDSKAPTEYKKSLGILAIGFLSIIFVLFCMIFINFSKEPLKSSYFSMSPDQLALARNHKPFKAIPFSTADAPSMSHQKVQEWLSKTLTRSLSFNFGNIDDVIMSSKEYFTDSGFISYVQSVDSSKLRESILKNRLVSTLTVVSRPRFTMDPQVVGDTLVFPGVETHAIITYTGASKPLTKKVIIVAELIQSPTWKNPQGLTIQSISTRDDTSSSGH